MPRSTLTEARKTARAVAVESTPGRFRIELVTPGWGSSGYYSAEVLEAAGNAQVFPAGTHMYIDHPRKSDQTDLPERSVRDLAAVLTETAVWDPTAGEEGSGALVAETAVFGPYREVLAEMADVIGVSLRAVAEVVENGEAEGRRGRIVTELVEGKSVDFVTHAGRGGRIVEVLESAARTTVQEKRSIGQWIESRLHRDFTITADDMAGDGRLTREERISLSNAIGDALTSFVRRLEADQPQLYARDLWEDPQDSVATALEAAKNVTAARPDSTTPNPKETPMGTIQVDEAVHNRAVEQAGRVDALESERDTEKARADAAEARVEELVAERAAATARSRAVELLTESANSANVTFSALEVKGLTADLPVDDKGVLDEAAFTKAVDEAAKVKAEEAGAGRVRGFGRPKTGDLDEVSESDVAAMIRRRAGTEQKGA